MTNHMEAAIEAGARTYDPEAWTAYDRESPSTEGRELMVEYSKSKAESILAAAEPHLRKKWAEEIRRIPTPSTDGIVDPLPSDWKALGMTEMKNRIIDLLEGAGK